MTIRRLLIVSLLTLIAITPCFAQESNPEEDYIARREEHIRRVLKLVEEVIHHRMTPAQMLQKMEEEDRNFYSTECRKGVKMACDDLVRPHIEGGDAVCALNKGEAKSTR
jgi:hypothetical protein